MSQKIENAKSLYLDGIRDGKPQEAVEKYTGERYIQHSTGVRDGKAGFIGFFKPFIERNPIRHIEIVRSFSDGQYVFLHAYQRLNSGESEWVTMDFFDTDENDKIIEHWDVIAAFEGRQKSGRTQVDGSTDITDIDQTEQNKAIVKSMIKDLLMPAGNLDKTSTYIHQNYVQHSPDMIDGFNAFFNVLNSPNRSCWYQDIVLLLGCGNFVATLCRVSVEGQEYAKTDLFRLSAGKIVEHWDAAEPVPAKEDLVNSGKF